MRLLTAIFVLWLGAAAGWAQDPAAPTGNTSPTDVDALITQLLNSNAGKIWVLHDGVQPSTSDTVNTSASLYAAFGELGSGNLSDAENTAKTFVRTYGKVFGFPDGEPLTGDVKKFREWPRTGTDESGRFLAYCAGIDNPTGGRPLFYLPSMVVFAFRNDGKLVAVTGRYKPIPPQADRRLPGPPESAIQFAIRRIETIYPETKGHVSGNGEIALYFTDAVDQSTGDEFCRAVYVIGLTVGNPPRPKRAIIAENFGDGQPATMLVEDARQLENSCDVFEWDPGTSYSTVNRDLVDLVYPGFWPDWTVNGKHFKVDPRIDPSVPRASDWNGWWDEEPKEPTDPNPRFGELHAYYHLTQARTKALGWGATADLAKHDPLYFNHWFIPRCSGFASGTTSEAVCIQLQSSNAWFNPFDTTLNFASQNVTYSNRYPAYDASVVYHEYGHFVHKMVNEHWKQGIFDASHQYQAQLVGEAFGDLFAASSTGQTKVGGWYMAKRKPPGTSTEKNKSRDIDVVKTFTQVANEREDGRQLEYHDASILFSGAMWKLRKDGVLPGDEMIKTTIAGLRMCRLPCDLWNACVSVIAADQMLSARPHTEQIAARFHDQQILPPLRKAGP